MSPCGRATAAALLVAGEGAPLGQKLVLIRVCFRDEETARLIGILISVAGVRYGSRALPSVMSVIPLKADFIDAACASALCQ